MNTVKKYDEFIEEQKMNEVVSDNHLDYEMGHEMARMNIRDNDKKGFPNNKFDIEIWNKEGNKEPHFHVIHKKDGYDVRIRISDGTVLSVESYGNKGRTHTFSELEPLAKYWLNDETNDVVFTGSNQLICYGEYFRMNPDSPYLKYWEYWDKINKQLKVGNDYVDDNELFGMANLSHQDTGLDVNVYVSLKCPGHNPRIKFQNNTNPSYDKDSLIFMSIDKDEPEIILPNKSKDKFRLGINNYQLGLVKSWVRINYDILLELWNGNISIIDFSRGYKKVK